MKNLLVWSGRSAFFAILMMLLTMTAFSQISLRKALDFDRDGRADPVVFRPGNATFYINKTGGSTGTGGGVVYQQFGVPNDDKQAPGDFDNDGAGDISVWRSSNGVWYRLNSSNSIVTAVQFGQPGDEPVARDYDGDGKTDLAVVRRFNDQMIWYVRGSAGSGNFTTTQFGLSTDFPVPGDYDGDGKFDLAVQRPGATPNSQATFFVQRSRDGLMTVNFGLSNDYVVPGDYDGDGITDLAVVREGATVGSNFTWYIRNSKANPSPDSSVFTTTTFGLTGIDYAVQNDYDGDGKADIAVWRSSNGTFYIINSLTGFSAFQWGQANDYPVANYDTH